MNRHKIVWMAFEFLQEIITEGWSVDNVHCIKGLPEGAVFVRSFTDEPRAVAGLVFQHPSFEPVEIGDRIPVLDIVYEKQVQV